jgi:glutamyl/glutaminyl-tRNA synthetase
MVVRGSDLESSTVVQRRISELLPGSTFQHARVLHHPLIQANGRKLSKSAGAQAAPLVKSSQLKDELSAIARGFAADLGY